MAAGVASLSQSIDLVCSGRWEASLPDLIRRIVSNDPPAERIQNPAARPRLDELPTPDYDEYFRQRAALLGPETWSNETGRNETRSNSSGVHLPYETSRGCWWGRGRACRFCGLNGPALDYDERSPDKVVAQLRELLQRHPTSVVMLTDNALPPSAPTRLLPRVAAELPEITLCAQVRTHHGLSDLLAMRRAGMMVLQAGVEALSTSLLRRMRKGVTARQNLSFLRNAARVEGLTVYWNLLYGFPGDTGEEMAQTLSLVPWIPHLPPPLLLAPLVVERFSYYFESADRLGITGLRQCQYPADAFPRSVDLERLASHFAAEIDCFSCSGHPLMDELSTAVTHWQRGWSGDEPLQPRLTLRQIEPERFVLIDSRPASPAPGLHLLTRRRAVSVLSDHRLDQTEMADPADLAWMREHRTSLELDGWLVSVVVAPATLVLELGADSGPRSAVTSAAPDHPAPG
jgi:ribosomal peptide maturation radical SAM protein 1